MTDERITRIREQKNTTSRADLTAQATEMRAKMAVIEAQIKLVSIIH